MHARRGIFTELSNQNVLQEIQDVRPSGQAQDITKMDLDVDLVDTPTQMLSVPFYFTSPLTTLLESLHDPDYTQVTLHDIMEAYDCFSDRIRSVADVLMHAEITPRALRIIEEHSSNLVEILKRDLQRPFSKPVVQYQSSFDLYSFGSPALDDNDAQYALDSAKLAQHALCFVSDICILRPLYSLFSDHDFQSILDDVFAFTVPSESPVLNESKLCTFIVWILQTQQLPKKALLPRKHPIVSTISRAVQGHFGSQAVVDGLKAIHSLLIRHGGTFLSSFVTLLSDIFNYTLNESLDVRLGSVYALSGFASAMKYSNSSEIGLSFRSFVNAFVDAQYKLRKDSHSDISLWKIIEETMSSSKSSSPCASPCWSLTLISSLIIILDYTLFFRPHCLKLIFSTLFQATHHKRSVIRALQPHIWKLLIWIYLRIPTSVDAGELGDVDIVDIKERSFKVVAQDTKNDIGIALVSSLLQASRTLDGVYALSDHVEKALALVQDMMCSEKDGVRENALTLFRRLYGLAEDHSPSRRKDQLLIEKLFDGSLLSANFTSLADLVRSMPSFTPGDTRQLTNVEIYNHWRTVVSLWAAAAKISLQTPESQFSDDILSTWISMLEIFVQRCDSLTPTSSPTGLSNSVVFIAGQLLDTSDVPDVQVRHLQFTKRVWSITKNVLYDTWLPSNAEIILSAVLKRNFTLEDREVLQAWSDLCAELISVGVPTLMHVVYFKSEKREQLEVLRQLWTVLARIWQTIDHGTTWDDLVTLLVIPFGAWNLSTEEFEQWESILRNAVRLAASSSVSGNAVITVFLERLGNSRVEAFKANPRALCSLLRSADSASYKKLDRKFFEFVDEALSDFYPPMPESLTPCIDLLHVLGELIATCPDSFLLELVKIVQRSISRWIQDENSILLEMEQNTIVNVLYCNPLERLSHHGPTFEVLDSIAPFLVSVFKAKHIPVPALGPFAFVRFWRKTFHGKTFEQSFPDDIKTCLKAVSLVWGGSIIGDLTTSDSQKSMSTVPDSQDTPPCNRHNSEQPHNPVSPPFGVLDSPLRRWSSSPKFTSPAGGKPKKGPSKQSTDNRSPRTPRNRQPSAIALLNLNSIDASPTSSVCAAFESQDILSLRKRKRRLVDEEHAIFRCRSHSSPPQFVLSMVQKSTSEPAQKILPATGMEDRSKSLPSPLKKRKLFDYTDLTNFRGVRSRASQAKHFSLNLNEDGKKQKRSYIEGSIAQDIEPVPENIDVAHILDAIDDDRPLSLSGTNNPESANCSQSLPVFERDEQSRNSRVRDPTSRMNQIAWAPLEEIQGAFTALQQTDGISQVPVQDLERAARVAERVRARLDDMINQKKAGPPPKTR